MSSESLGSSASAVAAVRRNSLSRAARRVRQIAATTTALTFMLQNLAWAACSDGSTFPDGGFTPATATNWSPLTFTGTLGSVWVPDISVNEHNNPGEPLTLGGHNWAFDQGSTTCKATDVGGASGPITAWSIPPNNATDCLILPIFRIIGTSIGPQLVLQNFGDIPQRGSALTPTCDPTLLSTATAPNPANTYLNQLGCALVRLNTGQIQATTPQTATTYLFTAGIKGGMFAYSLDNVPVSIPGQEAGKTTDGLFFYAGLNPSHRFDSAVITPDGKYLLGGSSRTNDAVFACRNPLGDPGDLTQPIDTPDFLQAFAVSTDTSFGNKTGVQCMQIGQGGDGRVKGLAVGADGQPYIGGINIMSNFTDFPACIAANFGVPAGTTIDSAIALAFKANSQNHCGNATPNTFLNADPTGAAVKAETQALVSHGEYLYRAIKGGAVYQAHVTATGVTTPVRQFAGKLTSPTGIGFDEGTLPGPLTSPTPFPSIVLYDDQSQLGLAAREALYKLPICEDMP
jgi:hypothetical protein